MVGVSASVTVMGRTDLPSATAVGTGAAGGVRGTTAATATDIDTATGMGVGPVTVQATGPAVDILPAIMSIVQIVIRHAPDPSLPLPIKGKQLPVHRQTGPTTFTPTGTATSTAGQTRDGSSAPARVGNQRTGDPKPSSNSSESARARCKGTGRLRVSSRELGSNKLDSLTAAIKHGSRAIKEPAVIISPAAGPVGVEEAEAEVVEVAVVAVKNF